MPRGWCARARDCLCIFFRRSSTRRRNGLSSLIAGGRGGRRGRGSGGRHDVSLNVILHGECGVGKTSLRNRWVDGLFTGDVAPTFGVDFNVKALDLVHEEENDEEEEKRRENGGGEEGVSRRRRSSYSKRAPSSEIKVNINVYDTSGKPNYREVNNTYLLAFDGVVFVYDISSMSTLKVSPEVAR